MEKEGNRETSVQRDCPRCPRCGAEIAVDDTYCRTCGKLLEEGAKWYHDPVWVWMLGLLVLGPLAIPIAWLSPKMSTTNKIVFTFVVGFLTVLFIVVVYLILSLLWNRLAVINETSTLLGY
ncbi:MAG: zinc ribbon domain-containing protein [Candidatus Hydrogenedentota bacterium]